MSFGSWYRLLLGACVALVFLGAAQAETVTGKDGKFTVQFPATPNYSTFNQSPRADPSSIVVVSEWEAKAGDKVWFVSSAVYPPRLGTLTYDNALSTVQDMIRQSTFQHAGLQGREVVSGAGEGWIRRERYLIVDRHFLRISYTGRNGTEHNPDVDRFFNSFKVRR